MTAAALPWPPADRWPDGGRAPAPPSGLARCLLLALLLHVWAVLWFGNAPGGSARPGEGVWGTINLRLEGLPPGPGAGRDAGAGRGAAPTPEARPAPPTGAGTATAPRWGGRVRDADAPPRPAEPGAARLGDPVPRADDGPTDRLPARRGLPEGAPAPADAATPPPTAAGRVLQAPAPGTAAPALPRPDAAPAAAPALDLPPLPPAAAPAAVLRAAPPPATPAPAAALPATEAAAGSGLPTLSGLPALPEPRAPAAAPRTLGTEPAAQLPRARAAPPLPSTAPAIPSAPPALPALPAPEALPAAAPARGAPDPEPGGLGRGAPDAGPRLGSDQATPAAQPAPRPRLNLDLPRSRGGELPPGAATGVLPLLPRPPELPSKLARDIEKAAKEDCRKAYGGAGLLAVVPLAVDAVRQGGCKW